MKWNHVLFGIALTGALGYGYSYEKEGERAALKRLEDRVRAAEAKAAEPAGNAEANVLSAVLDANSRNLLPSTPALQQAPVETTANEASPAAEPITQDDVSKALAEHFEQTVATDPWTRSARSQVIDTLGKTKIEVRNVKDVQCRGSMCRVEIGETDRSNAIGAMGELRNMSWSGPMAAFVKGDGTNTSVTVYLGEDGTAFPMPGQDHG